MVFQKFICWGTFHHLETFVFCLQGVWYELSCGVTQHLKKSSRGRFWPKIFSYRALAAARSTMAEHNVWWKRIVFVFAVTVTENGKQELLLYIYSLYSSQLWIFVAEKRTVMRPSYNRDGVSVKLVSCSSWIKSRTNSCLYRPSISCKWYNFGETRESSQTVWKCLLECVSWEFVKCQSFM